MSRPDISKYLIHFTKGETIGEALDVLCKILDERTLKGSTGYIKDGYHCVCFSEAPLHALSYGLANEDFYSKYAPLGIMVEKTWVFEQGGRPVIYQPLEEYERLPESLRWRHVTFNLASNPKIDFSWEREWRIHCDELLITPERAKVVVPDGTWYQILKERYEEGQNFKIDYIGDVFGYKEAEEFRVPFEWSGEYLLKTQRQENGEN